MLEPSPAQQPAHSSPSIRRIWLPLALLCVFGAVLFLPAVRTQLFLDDYSQAAMAHGAYPAPRGPLDLYDFVGGADRRLLVDRGVLPWWTDSHLRIRFLRPLASALLWLDHRVAGDRPMVAHLHSLAWWVAAVVVGFAFFRRYLPLRAAVLAICVFALAPCHAIPLAWLANREALVALVLGTLALKAYLCWREEREIKKGALATALFAFTLAAGEYGLCIAGYAVAFEATVRGERIRRRVSGLLPVALPVAIYVYLHHRLRYGALGFGFYADPFRDLPAFLHEAPTRLSALLVQGWLAGGGGLPSWGIALAAAALGAALWWVRSSLGAAQQRSLLWMFAGSILALLPVLATVPSTRLLGISMLGTAGVIGLLLDRASQLSGGAGVLVKVVALASGVAHLGLGPAASRFTARSFQEEAARSAARAANLRALVGSHSAEQIVVLRSIGADHTLPFMIDMHAVSPYRFRVLTRAGHMIVQRRGARTLEITTTPDRALFQPWSDLFRDTQARVKVGDVFKTPGMRVTILDVGAAGPRSARFDFQSDLGDASVLCLIEDHDGFHAVRLPNPGYSVPLDP